MRDSRFGYAGEILRIDLTTPTVLKELTSNYVPKFLGGKGINQWILFKELRPWVTPFEPANIVCFGAGPLVGTIVSGAARMNVDSKNALTGGIGSGSCGGWCAA
jgi:aldehyde:ferredoxin oxidoreductase